MDWGMTNRFSKIIKPKNGRCVMLAVIMVTFWALQRN